MIDIEKIREALENLKGIDIFIDGSIWSYTDTDYEDDIKLIEKALTELDRLQKKEVPMKVIYDEKLKGYCPICDRTDMIPYDLYCPKCGQKLDWSDKQ